MLRKQLCCSRRQQSSHKHTLHTCMSTSTRPAETEHSRQHHTAYKTACALCAALSGSCKQHAFHSQFKQHTGLPPPQLHMQRHTSALHNSREGVPPSCKTTQSNASKQLLSTKPRPLLRAYIAVIHLSQSGWHQMNGSSPHIQSATTPAARSSHPVFAACQQTYPGVKVCTTDLQLHLSAQNIHAAADSSCSPNAQPLLHRQPLAVGLPAALAVAPGSCHCCCSTHHISSYSCCCCSCCLRT